MLLCWPGSFPDDVNGGDRAREKMRRSQTDRLPAFQIKAIKKTPMDGTQPCRSIAIAGHTGDVELVEAALTGPDPRARVLALGAAARLRLLTAERLIDFLADDSPEVRYRALEVLPGLDDRAAGADAVTALLAGPEPANTEMAELAGPEPANTELAELAAFTLGEIEPQGEARVRAVEALREQATGHADALCRESAVAALGALAEGLDAILAACDDVATVRRRAVLALAPFDGPEVDRALGRALTDRDWQVRQAAEDLTAIE